MVGLQVEKASINQVAGDLAKSLTRDLNRVGELKRFLDRFSAQDLIEKFGFEEADANLLKSAIGDADAVRTAFLNNRTFLSQICGIGDV